MKQLKDWDIAPMIKLREYLEAEGTLDMFRYDLGVADLSDTDAEFDDSVECDSSDFGISPAVRELFSDSGVCDDFFSDGDSLDCAGWGKRAYIYIKERKKLCFYAKNDMKNLYEEIKKFHPKIAKYQCFQKTINNLNKKCALY